jgi:hypothetical protein
MAQFGIAALDDEPVENPTLFLPECGRILRQED